MSDQELRKELKDPVEPLLPIEIKLIAGSFGLGVVLLIVLVIVNRMVG